MVSENIRACVRNLYINASVSVVFVFRSFAQSFLLSTSMTQQIAEYMHLAFVMILIAWTLFFCHCCGEIWRELRRNNYHFLWSLIPFLLPLTILLLQGDITTWLLSKVITE